LSTKCFPVFIGDPGAIYGFSWVPDILLLRAKFRDDNPVVLRAKFRQVNRPEIFTPTLTLPQN
jgi:hypothetical protein